MNYMSVENRSEFRIIPNFVRISFRIACHILGLVSDQT